MARFGSVHVLNYNYAKSEPIWMKSRELWSTLLAAAAPVRFWA